MKNDHPGVQPDAEGSNAPRAKDTGLRPEAAFTERQMSMTYIHETPKIMTQLALYSVLPQNRSDSPIIPSSVHTADRTYQGGTHYKTELAKSGRTTYVCEGQQFIKENAEPGSKCGDSQKHQIFVLSVIIRTNVKIDQTNAQVCQVVAIHSGWQIPTPATSSCAVP